MPSRRNVNDLILFSSQDPKALVNWLCESYGMQTILQAVAEYRPTAAAEAAPAKRAYKKRGAKKGGAKKGAGRKGAGKKAAKKASRKQAAPDAAKG
ncbi:MAG TPA: hypothetical protein VF538_08845 [Pyrinomonadaceae bacterium]|jgi:hypothetical protein